METTKDTKHTKVKNPRIGAFRPSVSLVFFVIIPSSTEGGEQSLKF